MKVEKLKIEGFRGISSLELDFDPKLTVLVGANGVGKTSILDALAILLDQFVARYVRASAQGAESIRDLDINADKKETQLTITVNQSNQEKLSWTLVRQAREKKIRHPRQSSLDDLNKFIKNEFHLSRGQTEGLPLMIYYGQRRAVLDVPQRLRSSANLRPEAAFSNALKLGDINYREFVAWFRDQSLAEAQQWRNNPQYINPQLQSVRRAMSAIGGISNPTYRVPSPSGLCVTKNGAELRVDQLSSGEQCILALMGDLSRRLSMLNPNTQNAFEAQGIVLIDEVELHLHPGWQRQFCQYITDAFPNCQFIITTHSPQVLGNVHARNIKILTRDEGGCVTASTPIAAHGRDSNYILTSVLGGGERNLYIEKNLKEFNENLETGNFDKAEALLLELKDLIEGDAAELSLARHRLERMRSRAR